MANEHDRSTFGTEFLTVDQEYIIADFKLTVTYRRGTDTVDIDAVLDGVLTTYDDRTGIDLAIGDSSFWIKPDDLDFGSGVFQPKMHDEIELPNGTVYEVLEPGNLDSERCMIRIPTIRTEYTP